MESSVSLTPHLGVSLKQAPLHFGICGFLEIAQADTNQAKTLLGAKAYFLLQVRGIAQAKR